MGISRYLAMTAAELETFSPPEGWFSAFMACHFSPYTTGLSNIPSTLLPGSMLLVNDRTPIHGHDPQRIAGQLLDAFEKLKFDSLLLDLERPNIDAYRELCHALAQRLPCPFGVSSEYARGLDCAVFLPPAPLDSTLESYIAPWKGREIWLDIAPQAACVTITESGSSSWTLPFSPPPENAFCDEALHCRYRAELQADAVLFHLWRDPPQIKKLIGHAQDLGVSKCIGLYQELCLDECAIL
jgi:hypothetical protein